MEVRRLYIGGLSANHLEKDLKKKFKVYGKINDVEIRCKEHKEQPRYFGYVTIESDPKSIDECIQRCNNEEWKGVRLKVELAKESVLQKAQREICSQAALQQQKDCCNSSAFANRFQHSNLRSSDALKKVSHTKVIRVNSNDGDDFQRHDLVTRSGTEDEKRLKTDFRRLPHLSHREKMFANQLECELPYQKSESNRKRKRKTLQLNENYDVAMNESITLSPFKSECSNHITDCNVKLKAEKEIASRLCETIRVKERVNLHPFSYEQSYDKNVDNVDYESDIDIDGIGDCKLSAASRQAKSDGMSNLISDSACGFESERDNLFEDIDTADQIGCLASSKAFAVPLGNKHQSGIDKSDAMSENKLYEEYSACRVNNAPADTDDDPTSMSNLCKLFGNSSGTAGFTLSSLYADQLEVESFSVSDDGDNDGGEDDPDGDERGIYGVANSGHSSSKDERANTASSRGAHSCLQDDEAYWRQARMTHRQRSWWEMQSRPSATVPSKPNAASHTASFFILPGDARLSDGLQAFQTDADPAEFIDAWTEQAEYLTLKLLERKRNNRVCQQLAAAGVSRRSQRRALKAKRQLNLQKQC